MPPRTIWKGAISFGLVSIPVKTYGAISEHKTGMRMLCPKCKSPLQFKRMCPKHMEEVPWNDIVKGFEVQKGKYVTITPKELEKLELESGRLVEVFQFVDADKVDPIYFDTSYYLMPDERAEKPYFLMHEALAQYGKIAIGRVVMHEKEHLVALRPYEGAILMATLHYADEIRSPKEFPELKKGVEVDKEELELAEQLIRIMKKPFAFKEYKDRYHEALMKLVEAKMKGQEEVIEVRVPEIKPTKNLMEALKASIRAHEKR
ncbi:MAG TPA: Ku protein [Candidatus Bathyarchaeia archaeon]|nr:Ku protein [Candidatus Bathyarchaeia archaeon]